MEINFGNISGKIKYMNAVNNGPTSPNVRLKKTNYDTYKAAGISYARNHDASFYQGYGGEHTVDVHRIFKNFDADPYNPESYIFTPTDTYLQNIVSCGTKVFYRLGAAIEHGFKYGTYPPKDTTKWACICEHIIKHYTQGWANGFNMDIEYWEIWNEPDCLNADGTNPCWQGTEDEFIEFYCTASKYLKDKFPHLKIGGPAFCSLWSDGFIDKFLRTVKQRGCPLDFFSFHWYGNTLCKLQQTLDKAKQLMETHGFESTKLILNEWNYVEGWAEEAWEYTIKSEKGLKGASFIACAMALSQASTLDMLMYYDARPCTMNGMFDTDTLLPLKGYYPFVMFKQLLELGSYVKPKKMQEDIYACAATNKNSHGIMLSYFNNDDSSPKKSIRLDISGLANNELWNVEYYILNEKSSMELTASQSFYQNSFSLYLDLELFSTYYIKITKK